MSRGSGELLHEWTRQQQEMAALVVAVDDVPWSLDAAEPGKRLQRVAGLDISFVEAPAEPATNATAGAAGGKGRGHGEDGVCVAQGAAETAERGAAADEDEEEQVAAGGAAAPGVAALVVLSFPDMKLLYEDYEPVDLTIPYLPGYLGFREVDAYARLLRRLEHSPHCPQVLLVDGCGVLHPRGCGSACQVGVTCGFPAVGVAKNLLVVDGLDRFQVRRELQVAAAAAAGTAAAAGGSSSARIQQRAAAVLGPDVTTAAALEDAAAGPAAAAAATAAAVTRQEAALCEGSHTQVQHGAPSALGSHLAPVSLGGSRGNTTHGNTADEAAESHGDCGGPGVPRGDRAVAVISGAADAALGNHGARMPPRTAGSCAAVRDLWVPLVGDSGRTHGVALCPGLTKRPLYVSVGHRLSLDTAMELVRRCCVHRIPEPVRQADLRSRAWLRRHLAASGAAGTGECQ